MAKKYFSGSNSGTGFYNHFDGLVPAWGKLTRYFMIKGGPGVGKSTLMKAVVKQAQDAGEEVECFYCSGDPDSLDGVRLVKRGIVFADATAPHAMDPKYPGAVEEIVSLGDYIIRNKIVKYRDEIENLTKENKQGYSRAYAFLGAAAVLEEARYKETETCVDRKKLSVLAEELAEVIREKEACAVKENKSGERRLFLDAISCKGILSFHEEFFAGRSVYRMTGECGDVVTDMLGSEIKGRKQEVFCDPLRPHCRRHMWLPEVAFGLTCGEGESGKTIDADKILAKSCPEMTKRYREESLRLKEQAVECLKKCKGIHDDLEKIYRECVDFGRVTECTERLLALVGSDELV